MLKCLKLTGLIPCSSVLEFLLSVLCNEVHQTRENSWIGTLKARRKVLGLANNRCEVGANGRKVETGTGAGTIATLG